jgi:hypothetical protein
MARKTGFQWLSNELTRSAMDAEEWRSRLENARVEIWDLNAARSFDVVWITDCALQGRYIESTGNMRKLGQHLLVISAKTNIQCSIRQLCSIVKMTTLGSTSWAIWKRRCSIMHWHRVKLKPSVGIAYHWRELYGHQIWMEYRAIQSYTNGDLKYSRYRKVRVL